MIRKGTGLLPGIVLVFSITVSAQTIDYHFDGSISREVLENYLSRAITFSEILPDNADTDIPSRGSSFAEHLRFIQNTRAKFIGRAIFRWSNPQNLPKILAAATPRIKQLHAQDPDIIVQAAIFECVKGEINQVAIPAWVFKEFNLPVEIRNFSYDRIVYTEGWGKDLFGPSSSVPDMSRIETKMMFFFLAVSYINIGVEAIHFGQVELMDENDKNLDHWWDILSRIRAYAKINARRHLVLCDAHVVNHGLLHNGALLLDFHAFPLRIKEVAGKPIEGMLEVGYTDALYGKSKGGLTPSGWTCTSLPYLVEFDNWGTTDAPGKPSAWPWIWGYDEISWWATIGEKARNDWLYYAWDWLKKNDVNGFLEMPGGRQAFGHKDQWYWAHTASAATPKGGNQEDAIKAIWGPDGSTSISPMTIMTKALAPSRPLLISADGLKTKPGKRSTESWILPAER